MAPVQGLADRISGIFVPTVFTIAIATLGFWLGAGQSTTFAFSSAATVLIKGPEILDSTRRIDSVALDKTGTVTTEQMALIDVAGIVEGHAVVAGRSALVADWAMRLPQSSMPHVRPPRRAAKTAIAAGWEGRATATFVVADATKPTSAEAIRGLKAIGLSTVLLTTDNATTARTVAAEGRINEVIAEVMPANPVLEVVDVPRANAYYRAVFGVTASWTWGSPRRRSAHVYSLTAARNHVSEAAPGSASGSAARRAANEFSGEPWIKRRWPSRSRC